MAVDFFLSGMPGFIWQAQAIPQLLNKMVCLHYMALSTHIVPLCPSALTFFFLYIFFSSNAWNTVTLWFFTERVSYCLQFGAGGAWQCSAGRPCSLQGAKSDADPTLPTGNNFWQCNQQSCAWACAWPPFS